MDTKEPELEERGIAFLDRARAVRGLSPQQVARIERRLSAPVPSRRRFLIPAVVGIVLILSGGTALAWVTGTFHRLPFVGPSLMGTRNGFPNPPAKVRAGQSPSLPTRLAARPEVPHPAASPMSPVASQALAVVQEPSLPVPSESAASLPEPRTPLGAGKATPHRPTSSSRAAWMAPAETEPARPASPPVERPAGAENPESPIVAEGKSLAAVLSLWHQASDGAAALAALSAHERRFPTGQMTLEARLLRAEILIAEHREADALAILDKVPLANVPRGRELRTVRGELRIKAGRCNDGRADLDAIARDSDALARRAQYALSYCR